MLRAPSVAVLLLLATWAGAASQTPVAAMSRASEVGPGGDSVGVECGEMSGFCFIHVERGPKEGTESPGRSGTAGNAASSPEATEAPGSPEPQCFDSVRSVAVPCHDPQRGWWDPDVDCYHMLMDPQPPVGDPIWRGNEQGAIYVEVCPYVLGNAGLVWLPAPPPGMAASSTPEQLAERAIELLPLDGPDIRMAPDPSGLGLVGVPVWLWTEVNERTWGPVARTATIPGLSVAATARATRVEWSMGDGARIRCDGPGTPYRTRFGASPSPDCGHVYERSSAGEPGDAFRIRATTTWSITWAGGGRSGSRIVTRSSTLPVQIGELQVLVR